MQFGALQLTTRACYTRPPTETANTDAFVEVDEVTLQGEVKRIFTGWMFAASPGLHAVEHPIYDVWLTDCQGAPQPVAEAPRSSRRRRRRASARASNSRASSTAAPRQSAGAATPPPLPRRRQPAFDGGSFRARP